MPDDRDCPFCKKPFDARGLALGVIAFNPAMHLHVARCPNCQESVEFRARAGALEVGFTYWAGSMHFEGMATLRLRGFRPGETPGALELDGVCIYAPAA